jgi:N-acetyl-gamma-glutamyl-phosphate reductase
MQYYRFLLMLSALCLSHVLGFGKPASVAILGASGYTGAELIRLLDGHSKVEVKVLTSTERNEGKKFKTIYPQFAYKKDLPDLTLWGNSRAEIEKCDIVFCCLPHGTTQEIISELSSAKGSKCKIIDLSADFRLKNIDTYATWYGKDHFAPDLQNTAVYGLSELNRHNIKKCKLLANPGCYPTAAQLPLIPLIRAKNLIETDDIIIDAKSGTTGAGRAPKEAFLYCEVTDGIAAYGVASHRHSPEIEQGLSNAAFDENTNEGVVINFTPHLMPMSRGILEAIYVKLQKGKTAADLKNELMETYKEEPFVTILDDKVMPATRHVRGSNHCFMNVVDDRIPGRAIIVSAIDNLVKGASGQAIQNMNIMMGYTETEGLLVPPMFP